MNLKTCNRCDREIDVERIQHGSMPHGIYGVLFFAFPYIAYAGHDDIYGPMHGVTKEGEIVLCGSYYASAVKRLYKWAFGCNQETNMHLTECSGVHKVRHRIY